MALKTSFSWVILVAVLLLLFLINLSMGSVEIPVSEIFKILTNQSDPENIHTDIVWNFRMTKALTCILAGSGLSLAGLQMQTLFRNPLAGPDVLGLTSGASLAVSLIYMSGLTGIAIFQIQSSWTVAIAASVGCLAVFLIMILISSRLKDNVSLLIVGLMVGAGTSSIVSILQYVSKAEELQTFILWTFGSLGGLNWTEIKVLTVIVVTGSVVSILSIKTLNAWLLGDFYASSLGINLKKGRLLIILSACILTGGITAFCGPIAFVGLAVPHLVKILWRTTNHKTLIPAVIIGGPSLMLFCDTIAQLPGDTYVLPINAITAMIGAPIVIWVILKNKVVRA